MGQFQYNIIFKLIINIYTASKYCTRHQTGCGVVRSGGETYVVVVGGCCTLGSERRVEIYDVQEEIWIRGESIKCLISGY